MKSSKVWSIFRILAELFAKRRFVRETVIPAIAAVELEYPSGTGQPEDVLNTLRRNLVLAELKRRGLSDTDALMFLQLGFKAWQKRH